MEDEEDNDDEEDEFENDDDNEDDSNQNKLPSNDQSFQQFLVKATRIISLFLKDKNTRHELTRSVLLFLRLSCNLLTIETIQS